MRFDLYDTIEKRFVRDVPYGNSYKINLDGSVTVESYRDNGNNEVKTYKDRFIITIVNEEKIKTLNSKERYAFAIYNNRKYDIVSIKDNKVILQNKNIAITIDKKDDKLELVDKLGI